MQKREQAKQHYFTLIEMLVVIAIISILAALLMPALRSALDSAKDLSCASNHRGMGTAIQMYCNDYGRYMPYKEGHAHDIRNAPDSSEGYQGHGKLKLLGYIEDTRLFWCGNEDEPWRQAASQNSYSGFEEFAKETTNHNCEVDIWYRYGFVKNYQELPTENIAAILKPSQTGLLMCAGVNDNSGRIKSYLLHGNRGFNLSTVDGRTVWYDFKVHDPVSMWNSGAFYNCKKPKSALNYAAQMYEKQ